MGERWWVDKQSQPLRITAPLDLTKWLASLEDQPPPPDFTNIVLGIPPAPGEHGPLVRLTGCTCAVCFPSPPASSASWVDRRV